MNAPVATICSDEDGERAFILVDDAAPTAEAARDAFERQVPKEWGIRFLRPRAAAGGLPPRSCDACGLEWRGHPSDAACPRCGARQRSTA